MSAPNLRDWSEQANSFQDLGAFALLLLIACGNVANLLLARAPLSFGAVVLVLLGVSLVASWVPARRAARVDPLATLRSE